MSENNKGSGIGSAKQFTLNSIQDIHNGVVALAVNHAIRQCVQDINDRSGDKAKRKVTLLIELVPILDKHTAALDTIGATFKVKTAIPERYSHEYPMLATRDGTLLFQPQSPFDPRQQALNFDGASVPPARERIDKETGEVIREDDDERPEKSAM